MDSTVIQNNVVVRACKNPLTMQKTDYVFCEGLTIAQMLELANVPDYVSVLVSIDGCPVHFDKFKHVIPSGGSLVTIRAVPTGGGGGGGKNPLRTLLTIAVIAAAAIAGPVLGGYIGASLFNAGFVGTVGMGISVGTALASAAIMTVGMLAVNAIAPPPIPNSLSNAQQTYKDSPSYALSGARNTIAPYGVIPMLLGQHRITPPYGALPYTENKGNDQYLRCLFCSGYGKLLYSNHRLGETPIENFTEVEIETKDGSDSTNTTLYSKDVFQSDLAITLVESESWSTRTTQPNTTRIIVDVTWPRGLTRFNDNGSRSKVNSQLEIQYAVKDSGVWNGSLSGTSFDARNTSTSSITEPYAVVYKKETLIMDKITGALSIISNGIYGPASYGRTFGDSTFSIIPDDSWGLARWILSGSTEYGSTTLTNLEDIRRQEFIDASDFAVTNPSALNISVAAGSLVTDIFNVSANTTSVLRKSVSFKVSEGQYDVRIRRVSADTANDRILDTVAWTALKSVQNSRPILEPNMARTALRIKATEQLNGAIDNYNCIAYLVCPDYDSVSETWIERTTSNPASLYRYVLQGPANKRPLADSQIDLDILEEWHGICETNGFTFNHYFDYRTSIDSVLQMVAAAGRAAPAYIDGKYAVVMDKVQANIAQHFSPRNSWGYSYNKIFNDRPHAFRVKFWNKDADWREDERIVYDDGYSEATASLFEEMSLPGIDTSSLAWKHGRYHIATARLRPEIHTFNTDFEYLTCTRGDRVKFTNDVISVGLGYGRVKSYTDDGTNVLTVTIDEELSMEEGKSYQFRVRQNDGSSLEIPLITSEGTFTTFNVGSVLPVASAPDIDSLMLFGETQEESIDLIVKNISPSGDYTAQLACIAYAPEVHDSDTGTIPTFNTNITTTDLDRVSLYLPQFTLRSDESVVVISGDSFLIRILATFQIQNIPPGLIDEIEIRYRLSDTDNPYSKVSSKLNELSLEEEIFQGKLYDIQARYHIDGVAGLWSAVQKHRVVGLSTKPSDVTNFNLNILGDSAHLSWDAVTDIDLSHYVIKHTPLLTGATWGSSITLVEKVSKPATSISAPAISGTYLIKAVDKSLPPMESINAVSAVTTVPWINGMNVVTTITEEDTFLGAKTDCEVVSGKLRLVEGELVGLYEFDNSVDLGDVYTSRLSANIETNGFNFNNFVSGWVPLSGAERLSGTDPSIWSVTLELRQTNDDPSGTPTWSDWKKFIIGDYTARAFEFKVNLLSENVSITPEIEVLQVSVDMPDRVYGSEDITCTDAGLSVTFSPAFKVTPAIAITAQNMATGDYFTLSNQSATGFDIDFYNSSDVAIERTFDLVAKGYGYVN